MFTFKLGSSSGTGSIVEFIFTRLFSLEFLECLFLFLFTCASVTGGSFTFEDPWLVSFWSHAGGARSSLSRLSSTFLCAFCVSSADWLDSITAPFIVPSVIFLSSDSGIMLTSWVSKGKRLSVTIETYLGVWIVCLTDQEQLKLNQPMQNSVVSKLRDQFLCLLFAFFFFFFFFFLLSCFLLLLLLCFRGLIANDGINEKLIIQYQYSGGFICDFNRFSAVTKTPKESHSYRKCSSFRR